MRIKITGIRHSCCKLDEKLDLGILETAVASVIHHHDGLRLRYKPKGKVQKQYYDDSKSALNIKS